MRKYLCLIFLLLCVQCVDRDAFAQSPQQYADVLNGVVTNIVLWDGSTTYTPSDGGTLVAVGPNAQIGATYSGGVFTPPAAPTPAQGIAYLDTPTTGSTITLPNPPQPQNVLYVYLTPAAVLATLTIVLPSSPQDGAEAYIFSTKAITALTLQGGTLLNFTTPVATSAGVSQHIVYSAQLQGWAHL